MRLGDRSISLQKAFSAPSRRRGLWIVVLAITLAAIVTTVGVAMAIKAPGPQVTAKQSLATLVASMGDGVTTAGGAWTYEELTRAWVPGTAPGYQPNSCGGGINGPQQYDFSLWGPGMSDTDAASARMAKHWDSLGYKVRTIFRDGPALENGIQIFAYLPDGAYLGYFVSKRISALEGASVCLPASTFPPFHPKQ